MVTHPHTSLQSNALRIVIVLIWWHFYHLLQSFILFIIWMIDIYLQIQIQIQKNLHLWLSFIESVYWWLLCCVSKSNLLSQTTNRWSCDDCAVLVEVEMTNYCSDSMTNRGAAPIILSCSCFIVVHLFIVSICLLSYIMLTNWYNCSLLPSHVTY